MLISHHWLSLVGTMFVTQSFGDFLRPLGPPLLGVEGPHFLSVCMRRQVAQASGLNAVFSLSQLCPWASSRTCQPPDPPLSLNKPLAFLTFAYSSSPVKG